MSIYVIKSCLKPPDLNDVKNEILDLKPNSTPKISNFRMAKRCSVNLEHIPKGLDNYGDLLLLNYEAPCDYVDIYEKNGVF
jgi:hypothetical protein